MLPSTLVEQLAAALTPGPGNSGLQGHLHTYLKKIFKTWWLHTERGNGSSIGVPDFCYKQNQYVLAERFGFGQMGIVKLLSLASCFMD